MNISPHSFASVLSLIQDSAAQAQPPPPGQAGLFTSVAVSSSVSFFITQIFQILEFHMHIFLIQSPLAQYLKLAQFVQYSPAIKLPLCLWAWVSLRLHSSSLFCLLEQPGVWSLEGWQQSGMPVREAVPLGLLACTTP